MALMAPPEHSDDAKPGGAQRPSAGAKPTLASAATPDGLTTAEANQRLAQVGPNSLADTTVHPLVQALKKFWAPVPWMLEAAMVLEVVLGDFTEAGVIAGLLVFNAGIGLYQEGKAQTTLTALKSRLALNASVRRDGTWAIVASAGVVPGDLVKLSLGAVVPADVSIIEGSVLLDQSSLTGESEPVELGDRCPHLRRRPRPAGRGDGPGDKYRAAHQVRKFRRTGPHRACREFPAKGRPAGGAQHRHCSTRRSSWPWWRTPPVAGCPGARSSRSS